jgi:hypothetical protein
VNEHPPDPARKIHSGGHSGRNNHNFYFAFRITKFLIAPPEKKLLTFLNISNQFYERAEPVKIILKEIPFKI